MTRRLATYMLTAVYAPDLLTTQHDRPEKDFALEKILPHPIHRDMVLLVWKGYADREEPAR